MRLSCKKIAGIVTVLTGAILGGLSGSESVWATGSEGDNCYRLSWSIVTTSKTNYHSGRNQMEAGGGSGTEGQSSATKHESNRVCYDASNQKIYAEEVTNGEPMALAVQGDDLCLLTSKDGGGYEPAKCINDWKSSSGFDSDKLKNLGLMAGIDGVKIGEGVSGGARGKDFSEAAELSLSSEELARLRAVTEVKNVVEEQTKKEQEARDEEEEKKEADEGEKTCASSGAGGALGWILCPILENVSEAANDIYDSYIDPSLQVNADLFSGGDDGTRAAWEMFRNIANVAFIILLLVVIFSQLTGYGIDNYGIKKILPKLIVGVLLMNMSYLICVLCVDLSNIFGAGLKDMFDGLPPSVGSITIDGQVPYEGSTGRSLLSLGLLGLLGGGTAVVLFTNPAILLTLLVAAIGIGISIFFLFLLLSARQAAVVVLTVISPLAFAAFMLPNTKKYYDKWFKFMQVMLLVYPIAGLLVGGGNFVSRLLVSAAEPDVSFMTALTAMLVGVVPILFIPSVIKGSFAAFGSAGKALSGFGKQASGRATKALQGSEGYKNAQRMGLDRRVRIKAGIDKDGNLTSRGERKANRANKYNLFGARNRQAAYIAAAKKNIATNEESNAQLTNALAKTGIANSGGSPEEYYASRFEEAAQKGDISAMNAALSAAVSSGYMKDKDIAKMVRNAEGRMRFKDSATRASWMRDTATKYGSGFLATDYEMRHWMQGGGSNALGGYGTYAASYIDADDLKPEDITRLSGDSLAGLAAAGKIDQSMAQRVIASNPNISADKKIMLGAIASGSANITDANAFKEEAKALANNSNATSWTKDDQTHTITNISASPDTVMAWASSTPQDVNVVQNFRAGGRQYDDVNVRVRGGGNNPNVTPPPVHPPASF